MNAKNRINLENDFNYQDFYKSSFIWHKDEAVAFIQNRHTVQLLLPKKYLLRYPYYSASYNGFIEISSGIVWFAPNLNFFLAFIRATRIYTKKSMIPQLRSKHIFRPNSP